MNLFWPQEKVFLYGQLALFPNTLKGKALADAEAFLELKLTNIDRKHYLVELTRYLELYEQDELSTGTDIRPEKYERQRERLIETLRKQFDEFGYRQIISSITVEVPTFWELIFTSQILRHEIELSENMSFDQKEFAPGMRTTRKVPSAEVRIVGNMREAVGAGRRRAEAKLKNEVENEYEYQGLSFGTDGQIRFNEVLIPFSFQERQVMRLFLMNPEKLQTKDVFTDDRDVFAHGPYPNISNTLSKLVAAVNKKLTAAIGSKCILNITNEGWILKIQ